MTRITFQNNRVVSSCPSYNQSDLGGKLDWHYNSDPTGVWKSNNISFASDDRGFTLDGVFIDKIVLTYDGTDEINYYYPEGDDVTFPSGVVVQLWGERKGEIVTLSGGGQSAACILKDR